MSMRRSQPEVITKECSQVHLKLESHNLFGDRTAGKEPK